MRIEVANSSVSDWAGPILAIGVFKGDRSRLQAMDIRLDGEIAKLFSNWLFEGEWKQTYLLDTHGKLGCDKLLLIGLGEPEKWGMDRLRKASALAARVARDHRFTMLATSLHSTGQGTPVTNAQTVAEGAVLGLYRFRRYKTQEQDKERELESFILIEAKDADAVRQGAGLGETIANAANYVRDLVNTPASEATAEHLAAEAIRIANDNGLKVTVHGKAELENMGMNAILGVNKGSASEPKLCIMEWDGGGPTVAVIGKGITFDSGGLNLKSTQGIKDMKHDMAGAATVLGLMQAAVKLKLPVRLIGAFVATDNALGPNAQKPGDIIRAYNGKTIEVVNTDAEGRLILADALSYIEKSYVPAAIIDLATLTGACIIALGNHAAGVLGTDQKLVDRIREAGESSGERAWQLPLWEEYREMVKGDITDIINNSKEDWTGPGAITGAAFLSNFIERTPWAHIDIAGTAWWPTAGELHPKGATGWGVRLLIELLKNWQ